jgi:hypothetical protein
MSSTALDTDARAHFAHRDASEPDSCGNQPGCGVTYRDKQSYGPTFNKVGGGYYVLERTDTDIKMWFFLRNGWAPDSVKNPTDTIDTSSFPTPNAWFPNTQCDLNKHFAAHNIIINLTLCGEASSHPVSGSACLTSYRRDRRLGGRDVQPGWKQWRTGMQWRASVALF